jgi:hypothetical protein
MHDKIGRHLSYANVMATVALFVALGGGAYAATQLPANSVGPKQLKDRAVGTHKIGLIPAAAAHNSTPESIPNTTVTALTFNTNYFDNDFLHTSFLVGGNPNPERFYAPVLGTYLVSATVDWAQNTTGQRSLGIESDTGTSVTVEDVPATNAQPIESVTGVVHLTKGEYVFATADQNSGAPLNVNPAGFMRFEMAWLGP